MLVDRVDMDSWFFWMIDLVTAQKVSRSDSTVNCVIVLVRRAIVASLLVNSVEDDNTECLAE